MLLLVFLVSILLVVNSTKRLISFKTTSQKVAEAEAQLEQLKSDNEALMQELEYKKSNEFLEAEIRDKLGLAREGEAIVVLPKKDDERLKTNDERHNKQNWQKWWELFFGS